MTRILQQNRWNFLGKAKFTAVISVVLIAVGISGSQKTLMVGLQVCLDLGITILPMVAFHVAQLLVDTLIADRMRQAPK